MHVAWHNDPFTKAVSFPVKMQQSVGNDASDFRISRNAGAGALIEPFFHTFMKQPEILFFFERTEFQGGLMPVFKSPLLTFHLELNKFLGGQ